MAVHESQRILDPQQPEVELFRRQVDEERGMRGCSLNKMAGKQAWKPGFKPQYRYS
jgi:hypothetical protein